MKYVIPSTNYVPHTAIAVLSVLIMICLLFSTNND